MRRDAPPHDHVGPAARERATNSGAEDFARRYDEIIRHPRMQALYRGSGYFNVGLWLDRIDDQPTACAKLVDQVASVIAPEARDILDVGCGLGAGTLRLMTRFPEARVVGCNISRWQLAEAERRGVRETVVLDAAAMPFADETVDAVVAMESAQHFNTREKFLAEAWRVLRPGGAISLADMLFDDREPIGSWMLPPENDCRDPMAYVALLQKAGFEDIEVRDVTDLTWAPHCSMMRAQAPEHARQIDAFQRSLAFYVFAAARKPASRT
jgi:cyclopropane fatty-acyl-phospholipid synthase-like methyltransferase